MNVFFRNSKMAKIVADLGQLTRHFGQDAKWIAMCLQVLRAVSNLNELLVVPFYRRHRCHLLHNDKDGIYSVDVRGPYRLLFQPKPPVPLKVDGGIDEIKVDSVVVVDLHCDTHE